MGSRSTPPLAKMKPCWSLWIWCLLAACGGGVDGNPIPPPTTPAPTPTPDIGPLAQVTGVRVVEQGVDYLVWEWDPVEGATQYEAAVFLGLQSPTVRTSHFAVDPTIKVDGLDPEYRFGINVRAIRESGAQRSTGEWSKEFMAGHYRYRALPGSVRTKESWPSTKASQTAYRRSSFMNGRGSRFSSTGILRFPKT